MWTPLLKLLDPPLPCVVPSWESSTLIPHYEQVWVVSVGFDEDFDKRRAPFADAQKGCLSVQCIESIDSIHKENHLSVGVIRNLPISMHSCFTACLLSSTHLHTPDFIPSSGKNGFANDPAYHFPNPNWPDSWAFI